MHEIEDANVTADAAAAETDGLLVGYDAGRDRRSNDGGRRRRRRKVTVW